MSVRDDDARLEHIAPATPATPVPPAARIAALNDSLRRHGTGGRLFLTPGVAKLGNTGVIAVLRTVATFTAFTDHNDPHGEHDFGSIEHSGCRLFWKIDYYDRELEFGSPDPANPAVTTRVLTIMLADEY